MTAQAERTYRALSTTWDYRPSARWDIGGNYTYSETSGNSGEDEEFFSQFEDGIPEDFLRGFGRGLGPNDFRFDFRLDEGFLDGLRESGVLDPEQVAQLEEALTMLREALEGAE